MRRIGIILFCFFVIFSRSNCGRLDFNSHQVIRKSHEVQADFGLGVRDTNAHLKYNIQTSLPTDYNCSITTLTAIKEGDAGSWNFEEPTTFKKCSNLTVMSQKGLWLNIDILMGLGNLRIKGVPSGNILFDSNSNDSASLTDTPDTLYFIVISGVVTFNLNFKAVGVCAVTNCNSGTCSVNATNQPICTCMPCYYDTENSKCSLQITQCVHIGNRLCGGATLCKDSANSTGCFYYCECPDMPTNCPIKPEWCDGSTECPTEGPTDAPPKPCDTHPGDVCRATGGTCIETFDSSSYYCRCPELPECETLQYCDSDLNCPTVSQTSTSLTVSTKTKYEATTIDTTVSIKSSSLNNTERTTSLPKISTSTSATSQSTTKLKNASPLFPIWLIFASSVVLIFIIIIFITIVIIWLIKRKKVNEQQMQFQYDILQKAKDKNIEVQHSKKEKHWKMYLDSKNLVINFDFVLGKGSNATVYKAFQKNANNFPVLRQTFKSKHFLNSNIAAKIPNQFNAIEAEEFIREINSLIFLKSHDHIISFLGWTMFGEIPVLITELADTTLLTYVQGISKNENCLIPCLQYLWQISYALEYVAEKKMIHRDVACRNILLKGKNVAKLADFGLCCFADPKTGTFKDSFNKKFPIKWLSLEAMNQCIFSEKSDVWAFGILCFEVFSYGSIPYSKMLNSEMIEFVQIGKRLEKPINAPDYVYKLMMNCWRENYIERPTFKEFCREIRIMLENETLKYNYLSLENAFDNM